MAYASFCVSEQLDVKILMDGEIRDEEELKVNFGEINEHSHKKITLIVKSNTGVSVSISSKHRGRMVLIGEDKKYTPYYIPYIVESKGEKISLVTKTTLYAEPFDHGKNEYRTPLNFILKPDAKKTFCGKYTDRVSISVSSL